MARLYHNPHCSKSQAALALLNSRGIQPEIVSYLEQPPSPAELQELLTLLGMAPRDLLRAGDAEYTQLGLADLALDASILLAAMHAHPRLMERPIFVHRGRAVLARPPERVLELLDSTDIPAQH